MNVEREGVKTMKLWRISQHENGGYDTYDNAVVAAETEGQARLTHPGDMIWNGETRDYDTWCSAKHVKVELIGEAVEGTEAGVICASFNAG